MNRPRPRKFAGSRGGDGLNDLDGPVGTVILARAMRESCRASVRPGAIKVAIIRPIAPAQVNVQRNRVDVISAPPAGAKNGPRSAGARAASPWVLPRQHAKDQAGSAGPTPVSSPIAAFAGEL
jgi:hypothetical protein